tara:strand:- start:5351 stop:5575 length:225 start_codon:yes stop_codon:yes gene_type:complete
MPARKTPQKLLTVKEVAEILSVNPKTVYRYMRDADESKGRSGLWPYFYLNGSKATLRIPEAAVLRLQERSEVTA